MPAPPLSTAKPLAIRPLRNRSPALRVFICDDDLEFADELAQGLFVSGFEVRTLRDGTSPVQIFELFAPQIVLLDIYMPPPDGFEVMNHIVSDTRQRNISLILASGAEDAMLDVARQFCTARGITPAAVLKKPIRLAAVLAVCRAHGESALKGDPQG